MIFATDSAGQCIHVSQEWTVLTGQSVNNALGRGWVSRLHQDDRAIVAGLLDTAAKQGAEFSLRYRLLKPDDTPRWVGAGGVPSFGMEDNRFIGYLGSVTELAAGATDTIAAYGNIGHFVPPAPHPATMPSDSLDLIADHLIIAHSLLESDGVRAALPGVKQALLEVGIALAARAKNRARPLN